MRAQPPHQHRGQRSSTEDRPPGRMFSLTGSRAAALLPPATPGRSARDVAPCPNLGRVSTAEASSGQFGGRVCRPAPVVKAPTRRPLKSTGPGVVEIYVESSDTPAAGGRWGDRGRRERHLRAPHRRTSGLHRSIDGASTLIILDLCLPASSDSLKQPAQSAALIQVRVLAAVARAPAPQSPVSSFTAHDVHAQSYGVCPIAMLGRDRELDHVRLGTRGVLRDIARETGEHVRVSEHALGVENQGIVTPPHGGMPDERAMAKDD